MTLARHIAKREIRVNVLCPGGINTELKLGVVEEEARRHGRPVEEAKNEAKQQLGDPEGVGRVIAFLASDEAQYVRGTMYTR
jgi:NAD(P)-dependent dehydrogenase (short-subunit alcohol dehydrogenase family)